MSTVDELVTPMTTAEATTAIYAALAARGVKTAGWKPGAVVRTIIAGLAIVLAALSTLQAALAKSAFLDYAAGQWLTLVARYVFEIERTAGSFATGTVTLNNAGGGVYAVAIGDFLCSNPTTGAVYRNTAAFAIGALETGVSVAIEAVEAGADSSSADGTITNLVTPLLGVTCTNAAALVGLDEESDAALRARCRAKWSTLGTGSTAPAYEYWSFAASSEVVRVEVRENDNLGVTTDGDVTVVLASASGAVSAAVVTAVDSYIQDRRPLCANVHVASATALSVPVTAALTVRTGFGAAAGAAASTNLAALASSLRIGETVYRSALIEALMLPDGMVNVVLSVPVADVALSWDEIASITPTVTYTEIP